MNAKQIPKSVDALAALRELGYPIPNPTAYWDRAYVPDTSEVRYFRFPQDKQQADFIASLLRSFDPKVRSSYVISKAEAQSVKPIFQVWFGDNAFSKAASQPALARIYLEVGPRGIEMANKIKPRFGKTRILGKNRKPDGIADRPD